VVLPQYGLSEYVIGRWCNNGSAVVGAAVVGAPTAPPSYRAPRSYRTALLPRRAPTRAPRCYPRAALLPTRRDATAPRSYRVELLVVDRAALLEPRAALLPGNAHLLVEGDPKTGSVV
jgi:hypothetical protein